VFPTDKTFFMGWPRFNKMKILVAELLSI
jgi:hypothetical protein